MNNLSSHKLLLLLAGILPLFIFSTCDSSGSTELNPAITDVQPESGPPGTAVTITGNNFSPSSSENTITFDGNAAPVNSASETELETEVPQGIETGVAEIQVTVDGNTATGLEFTVEAEVPGISSVEPDSGTVGTEVTIQGMNFSTSAAENSISFAGTSAPVNGAAADQLLTEVPEGAQDGPVEVTVNGKTATGPDFDVITTGMLEVMIETIGSQLDPDGYSLRIDGSNREAVDINDTTQIENLDERDYELELANVASNCTIKGNNPRNFNIIAGETTSTTFNVECVRVLQNKIVYTEWNNPSKIYAVNPDGSGKELLYEESGITQIDVSPDGKKIVYSRGSITNSNLFKINADGTGKIQLTTSGDGNNDPAWSPNGDKIVFSGDDNNGDNQLFVINEDGSNRQQLTFGDLNTREPHWSPDGSKIVFDAFPVDNYEIYVVNANGTNPTQLTSDSGSDHDPVWSPDGSKIAFASSRERGNFQIYTMNPDGSDVQQLTDNENSNRNPAWSPNGIEITFDGNDGSFFNIYTVNSSSGESVSEVTTDAIDERDPKWSPED